jgi:hypothetical protein
MELLERDTQTTSEGKTFYVKINEIVLGCEHKEIYQGYWWRGMCMNCGEYIDDIRTA